MRAFAASALLDTGVRDVSSPVRGGEAKESTAAAVMPPLPPPPPPPSLEEAEEEEDDLLLMRGGTQVDCTPTPHVREEPAQLGGPVWPRGVTLIDASCSSHWLLCSPRSKTGQSSQRLKRTKGRGSSR